MSHAVTTMSGASSSFASSIAFAVASSAVGDPSVASITGFISLLLSKLEADAKRELAMRVLGLDQASGPLEAFTHLEQIGDQVGPANVDPEAGDQAAAFDDG